MNDRDKSVVIKYQCFGNYYFQRLKFLIWCGAPVTQFSSSLFIPVTDKIDSEKFYLFIRQFWKVVLIKYSYTSIVRRPTYNTYSLTILRFYMFLFFLQLQYVTSNFL